MKNGSLAKAASSLSSTLQSFIDSPLPSQGQKIQAQILKSGFRPDTNISIKLLILHLKCGSLSYARQVFDQMPTPPLSAYNFMISGYMKRGWTGDSLELVRRLTFAAYDKPDEFTMSMVLKITALLSSLKLGRQAHAQIIRLCFQHDEVLFTALIDSYAKNGKMNYARRVFDEMSEKNVVCSTAMITGYMDQGSIRDAEKIFESTVEKDTVVFNAMIEGYSKTMETSLRSLEVYKDMQRLDFWPTISTFSSVIGACSVLIAVEFGEQLHGQLIKVDMFSHVKSGSALVDMYSKCGRIEDARRIFDSMPVKNVVTWTCLIDGYGKNGIPNEALELFYKMRKDCNVKPNDVTFLSALSACGHAGLVSNGREIFESMEKDHSITPRMEHYACMVDLLGRAGNLHEALDFIKRIPGKPNSDVWAALLGACRLHGNIEMASFAANEVFELKRDGRPGAYVALSNTFAAAGNWESVCKLRELMKGRGVAKDTGRSWVGTDEGFHSFHVCERN